MIPYKLHSLHHKHKMDNMLPVNHRNEILSRHTENSAKNQSISGNKKVSVANIEKKLPKKRRKASSFRAVI